MKTSENRIRKQLSKIWLVALCVIMIAALTGCRQTSPEPTPAIESPPPAPSPQPPLDLEVPEENETEEESGLPETIETVIEIEGMEEPMVLNLFHEPGFPFYTYYPEDMIANAAASEEGDRVIIATDFGVINPSAYIAVTVYHADQFDSEEAFLDAIGGNEGILSEREYEWVEKEAPEDRVYEWTMREYFFMSDEFTGAIYAGEHEGQFFFFDIHYPWEYGDGMVPRVDLVMEYFTWLESGKTLID